MDIPNNFHLSIKANVSQAPKDSASITNWLSRAITKITQSEEEPIIIVFPENISHGTARDSDTYIDIVFPANTDEMRVEIHSHHIIIPEEIIALLNQFDLSQYQYTLSKKIGENIKTENNREIKMMLIDIRNKIVK